MSTTELINIVALIISPLVAVLISRWLDDRRQRRQYKLHLFAEIFGRRDQVATPELVRALNLIDAVFHDDKEVRKFWRELLEMYGNEGLQNENGFAQRQSKMKELTVSMAKSAGLGSSISHLDTERVYVPAGLVQQQDTAAAIQKAMIELLNRSTLTAVDGTIAKASDAGTQNALGKDKTKPSRRKSGIVLVESETTDTPEK